MAQSDSAMPVPKEYELITSQNCLVDIDKFLSHPDSKLFLLEAPSNFDCGQLKGQKISLDGAEKGKVIELEGIDNSLYVNKGESLLHNIVCLFPAKEKAELSYKKPIDYYGKIMCSQNEDKREKAIAKREVRKVREGLVMPKNKEPVIRKKSKKKITKKAIRKIKK
eukprot:TRINITY_DN9258_c0_g2_i1.p1 TRINITY_DN9258_c0_g2~~TRINITY_DN9258_c0_g2_i1.p1  ORF type:complete len:166 (+),score=52.31 TRINITY_DN9258_c0_g2_i1:58-555(+)